MEYFIVFSDEDNFDQDKKGNQRNDVSTVMRIRHPADVMIWEVDSNEREVMHTHFFPQGLRANADKVVAISQSYFITRH